MLRPCILFGSGLKNGYRVLGVLWKKSFGFVVIRESESRLKKLLVFGTHESESRIHLSQVEQVADKLGYGNVPDFLDEYLNMSDRTSRESLQEFCEGVIRLYGKEYLRRPTAHDVTIFYNHHATRHGFPGMLGSVDLQE
ncbi:hypothetical protein QVD17_28523 [Tagetes erecta]|uniref:Uncharacterized protein n=1 Tax=Tagetes erecta TaxID=13708 RepID=A0AAD8NS95_TARER|nr:hypothetical protein QVD17_28523 [Tagetes erecta]